MIIEYNNNKNPQDLLKQCLKERDFQAHRLEELVYRSSMIAATLIGIVTVFVDSNSQTALLRILTASGVLSLSFSVLFGLSYCLKMIRTSIKRISYLIKLCLEDSLHGDEYGVDQTNAGWLAISCLVLLCFGILSFAARILIIVWFLP